MRVGCGRVAMASSTSAEGEGEASGWVSAYTTCDHLHQLSPCSEQLPAFDSFCGKCDDPTENWLCLSCVKVFCGRFINGHMLAHSQETGHPIAIGYRDLSVWCFACDNYLDAQVIRELRPTFDRLHLQKFGVPAPERNQMVGTSAIALHLDIPDA